jgi:hypothetical protein
MSQIEDEISQLEIEDEECQKCIKEAKLNSHNTNDCYSCRQARKKPN